MRARILVLSALCLSLGACSSMKPLPSPTVTIPLPPPSECLAACPRLPTLDSGDEAAVVVWMHEVISAAGECRRMHDACRRAQR